MAKSTYLQLCNLVIGECGVSGGDLVSFNSPTGVRRLIIEWVAQADLETQGRWFDWDFLHTSTWSSATVIGNADVAAPSDIGTWDTQSFFLNFNTASYKKLTAIPYKTWRSQYRQGVKTNSTPERVAILPTLAIKLDPPPAAIQTLTADYWKRPVKMTAVDNTSVIPEEYERVIVARAKISYGEYMAAGEILGSGQVEYDDLLDKLEAKYLPYQSNRRMADQSALVVRPE
jgi:hypothetical protein